MLARTSFSPTIPFQAFVELLSSVFHILDHVPDFCCQEIFGLSRGIEFSLQHCLSSLLGCNVAIVTSKYFVNAGKFRTKSRSAPLIASKVPLATNRLGFSA